MVAKVLTKAGAVVHTWKIMHKAVVKKVFLYGSESWVVTGYMFTVLEGFHHWVDRKIVGKIDRRAGE